MNLSKITPSLASFLAIIALSTCAVAGTADIVKKQQLQQMRNFQLSQSQPGISLRKAASGSKEITVADSVQTYTWGSSSWEQSGCNRYSYDSKGRIKEEIVVDENNGSESKNTYEYDADGKTVKNTSIWNLSVDGELFMSETTYSIFKYYPGYTNELIVSDMSDYIGMLNIENAAGFYDLDSIVVVAFDGEMDSTYKSVTKYTRISDKRGRSNTKYTSIATGFGSMDYHTDFTTSGNGKIDTTKSIIHFDGGSDSLFEEFMDGMQYMLFVSRTNQDHLVEQTFLTATDSSFASCTGNMRVSFYTNTKGDIDSMVTQEWDTQQNAWTNTEKAVYSLKKISVGVEKNTNNYQAVQQVTFVRKNGTLYLNIPGGMTVFELEQLDLQGRVLSRTVVTNAKNSIAHNLNLKGSSIVNLVRVKTSGGDFTCKIRSVR
jgi:hypothetical protein